MLDMDQEPKSLRKELSYNIIKQIYLLLQKEIEKETFPWSQTSKYTFVFLNDKRAEFRKIL